MTYTFIKKLIKKNDTVVYKYTLLRILKTCFREI